MAEDRRRLLHPAVPMCRDRPTGMGKEYITDGHRCGTLMRHFLLLALAITLLAGGMGKASLTPTLVVPAGPTQGFGAGDAGTTGPAILVTPITGTTDHHLATTTGTVE